MKAAKNLIKENEELNFTLFAGPTAKAAAEAVTAEMTAEMTASLEVPALNLDATTLKKIATVLLQVFNDIDTSNDQVLSHAEMKVVFDNGRKGGGVAGKAYRTIQDYLKLADKDGDGIISFDEFMVVADADNSGSVTFMEFFQAMGSIGQARASAKPKATAMSSMLSEQFASLLDTDSESEGGYSPTSPDVDERAVSAASSIINEQFATLLEHTDVNSDTDIEYDSDFENDGDASDSSILDSDFENDGDEPDGNAAAQVQSKKPKSDGSWGIGVLKTLNTTISPEQATRGTPTFLDNHDDVPVDRRGQRTAKTMMKMFSDAELEGSTLVESEQKHRKKSHFLADSTATDIQTDTFHDHLEGSKSHV